MGIVAISFSACSETDVANDTENKDTMVDTPQEAMSYENFTEEKLIGEWEAVDAKGYSKDKIIGQTYKFGEGTATFYGSYGDGGMRTGELVIEGETLKLIEIIENIEMGNTYMTSSYTGGFNGDKLYLKSPSEEITLKRK